MAEPIGPEAYLAIASSLQNAINTYRNKNRTKQNDKIPNISTDSSKSSLTLPADELLSHAGLKISNDGYVQWAIHSPAHPRNWSRQRKAYDFGLILFLEFFMSAISAVGTPASFTGVEVLGQTREVGLVAFTTMYLLGQALGALLLSPYLDRFGRRTLYIGSAFIYSVFCLPVAATSNIAGVLAGRLITGVISAVPAMTTPLTIEDLFETEGRMWAFFSWALATNLGIVLGPIYASYVAASLNWRWPFYLATIIVAVTGILMSFIRESHASRLLERIVAAIQSHRVDLILRTAPSGPPPSVFQPLILLSTRPSIFLSSLANAFSTALLYLFAVAFPLIYALYGWNSQKTTLIFLFVALGLFFSTLTRLHDRHTTRKNHPTNHRLATAKTLFGLAIGAPALAVGLWWFAWTIPGSPVKTAISWPASALSLIPIGYAINEYSTVLPRYVLGPHSYSQSQSQSQSHKINNNAASTALLTTKALLSALFPLFAQHIFETLGANTAGSVLAAIATAFCLIPLILTQLGVGGRGSSPSDDDLDDGTAESAQDFEKKKKKVRKTVRWDDETEDSSGKGSRSGDVNGRESVDVAEMEMESKGAGMLKTEMEMEMEKEDEDKGSEIFSRVGTRKSESESESENRSSDADAEVEVVETEASSHTTLDSGSDDGSGSDGSADSSERKKEKEKEKEKENKKKKQEKEEKEDKKGEKEMSRVDDGDDGVAGFLRLDLERLAVFPYF